MNDWRPPIIETQRLVLRPVEEGDAEAIFTYASNPSVAELTSWYPHGDIHESLEYIRGYVQEHYRQQIPEPWGLVLKENPEMVIGTAGISWHASSHHCMDLHYALSDTFWGNGLVPEACTAVVDYAFKNFRPKRIQARCGADNASAARAIEKIGFTYEGIFRASRYEKGRFWDMKVFSLLDTEWNAKSEEIKAAILKMAS
jgi:ribosomal-protein-alanine N-acetyltransferase